MKLYKNLRIFTMDDGDVMYEDGCILTDRDRIVMVGNLEDVSSKLPEDCLIMDGKGGIAVPGMITAHAHFYGQFVRGMPMYCPTDNWQQILSRLWWKFDKKLTEEQVYYSAMSGLIEGVKAGTTCYFDHQASPNAVRESLQMIERAVMEAGARACLSYEVSDRNGPESRKAGIDENVRFINRVNQKNDPMIKALFGLHASYTLEQETLRECAEIADDFNTGFHIHVAEDRADVDDCYRRFDKHVVERLAEAGILGKRTIAAHCVDIGETQWRILKETGTTVAHNVQSNTNNAVGICPAVNMLKDGVKVALGGDGYTYDLFHELSFAVIMQRNRERNPNLFSREQVRELAYGSVRPLAENIFGQAVGCLKPGAAADFLIVDYDSPTPVTAENIFAHMMAGFSGHVRDVIIGGKEVVKDGRCTQIDEEKILAEARKQAERLWKSV